ncbi:hypothetical protein [Blastococcus sp. TF02A-26]|uniref:hypothetical protein n=1 Tax=Blastococcus sp. TF02A-26 TaxID=2250577 RepID=UPI000DE93475|nr:hypothetical protein [Blastococcus sp. TF02A-26]RBY84221.1 hypothetical protein DQ240_15365 [Blastococcus sp. TF02A-26]
MLTVPLAWTTVLAAAVAAALFGQTARTGIHPRGPRRTTLRTRVGLAVSMSGPWLVLLAGIGTGAATGAWTAAAAGTFAAVVAVALTGLALAPR